MLLTGVFALNACTKDRVKGWVTGTVTIHDPEYPLDQMPIEGIKVLLVDLDYMIDSADYSHNEAAVIDETITSSDGRYLISGIPSGEYAVIPVPDAVMYQFTLANEGDTEKFTVSKESYDYLVDFTAPDVSEDRKFTVEISIINRLGGGTITVSRPVFLYNIFPTYNAVKIGDSYNSLDEVVTIEAAYGGLGYLYVVSNNLQISAFDKSGYWLFTRWVANNYFNTPEFARWQIDWSKQTIERIE